MTSGNENNKIQCLGFCKAKASILNDILDITYLQEPLTFLLNIEVKTEIDFFTQIFPYKIFQPIVKPDPCARYILAVSGPENKAAVFHSFHSLYGIQKQNFIKVIHPSASIARSSYLHEGCVIDSLVSISSQTEIRFGTDIKRGAQIGHHNQIGEYSDINPGVILCGYVTLGERCSIGAGSIIRDGVSIGKNTIIGMGSVVTSDIPEGVIAYGNPCKIIKSRST
jgi:sugar O-acyltransferase (sialic acid O-acetyltransferase NeuD family)